MKIGTYLFREQNSHFAFYAFRQDVGEGMDYELGDQKLTWRYWKAIENKTVPVLNRKDSYPAFTVLKNTLNAAPVVK